MDGLGLQFIQIFIQMEWSNLRASPRNFGFDLLLKRYCIITSSCFTGEKKDEELAREIHLKLNSSTAEDLTSAVSSSCTAGPSFQSDEDMARRLQEEINRGF
jgi:hypothetical protein